MSRQFRCDFHISRIEVNEAIDVHQPRQRIIITASTLHAQTANVGTELWVHSPAIETHGYVRKFSSSIIKTPIVFGFRVTKKDNPDVKNFMSLQSYRVRMGINRRC